MAILCTESAFLMGFHGAWVLLVHGPRSEQQGLECALWRLNQLL